MGKPKKGGGPAVESNFEYVFPSNLISKVPDIKIDVRLVTWKFMAFEVILPRDAQVYNLLQKIVDNHGGSMRIEDLTVYIGEVSPKCIVTDLHLPLRECGIEDTMERIDVFYDFSADGSSCPLLLSSPRGESGHSLLREHLTNPQRNDGSNSARNKKGRPTPVDVTGTAAGSLMSPSGTPGLSLSTPVQESPPSRTFETERVVE
eukprot:Rmarinus@m.29038